MTKKHNAPRVLTVDDGKAVMRRTNASAYGFVFSDDINVWIKGTQKCLNRTDERWRDSATPKAPNNGMYIWKPR